MFAEVDPGRQNRPLDGLRHLGRAGLSMLVLSGFAAEAATAAPNQHLDKKPVPAAKYIKFMDKEFAGMVNDIDQAKGSPNVIIKPIPAHNMTAHTAFAFEDKDQSRIDVVSIFTTPDNKEILEVQLDEGVLASDATAPMLLATALLREPGSYNVFEAFNGKQNNYLLNKQGVKKVKGPKEGLAELEDMLGQFIMEGDRIIASANTIQPVAAPKDPLKS